MPEIQAILFDCDGTLVDSEPISLKVLVELVSQQGLDLDHQAAIKRWAGCDLKKVLIEIEEQLHRSLPDNFLDVFRETQLQRLEAEIQPIQGAAELVQSISLPKCVCSNAPIIKMQLCLKATGLLDFFGNDGLFSAYQVEAWKPEPDLFLYAAEQIGIAPAQCAVIEDSQFGIDAGLAAGMTVYSYDPHSRHEPTPGVQVVRDLTELVPILGTA